MYIIKNDFFTQLLKLKKANCLSLGLSYGHFVNLEEAPQQGEIIQENKMALGLKSILLNRLLKFDSLKVS